MDLVTEKNSRNVKRIPLSFEVVITRWSEHDKSMYFRAVRLEFGTGLVRNSICRYDLH